MTTTAGTWHDQLLEPAHRADLLLAEMTTAEKCHQLTSRMPWSLISADGSDAPGADDVLRNPPGHIAQLIQNDAAQLAAMVGTIQHQVLSRSRLGIPVLFHAEALSGFLAGGHMVFPSGTGLAAGWSPDLVEQMADLIRRQMRRTGMMHALSPVLDVALDPRWGRVHETFGEDPYLCAALGVAYVRSLQGQDLSQGVMATGKHFLGHAVPLGGMNTASFEAGARATRDLFAYPFEAAIQLAGLRSVMNSYSDIDGIPAGGSPEVLQDLLRDTLGFEGFVSSDYGTTERLVNQQQAATDAAQAGRLAIEAGLDVEFPNPFGYGDVLAAEVERGAVDVRQIDRCVRRVLRAKFEVGLFEHPYPTERIDIAVVAREGDDLSQELARRSIVLAKNSGLLPLSPGSLDVAVIGPHADAPSLQFPTYTYASWREANEAIIQGELGTMNGAEDVVTAWYETISDGQDAHSLVQDRYGARSLVAELGMHARNLRTEPGSALTRDLGDEAIEGAVAAAHEADVVVLALGGASLWFTGERTEGEASDTADIALPAAQVRLAEAVAATGTPMVVVLVQGRAYALPKVIQDAAAIVIAPYAGPFGNRSITDVLFGTVNPSGKLPYSIPRHSGQLPVYHHQKSGSGYRNLLSPGVMQRYLDMDATPLWPFGHGLSYSTFALDELDCGPDIDTDGTARISATVANSGDRDGAVVVQLYLRVNTTGVTRPAQQLGGFARIHLAPGEQQRVTFAVDASQLAYTNLARQIAVEPARVDVFVGFDSDDRSLEGSFHVTGAPRIVAGAERSFLSTASLEPHADVPLGWWGST
jgi:beta-glucosidase-like glycosyl hydrolase